MREYSTPWLSPLQVSDFDTNCPISDSSAGKTGLSDSCNERIGTKEPLFLLFFGISRSMERTQCKIPSSG